jgi:hypothetical protein
MKNSYWTQVSDGLTLFPSGLYHQVLPITSRPALMPHELPKAYDPSAIEARWVG